MREKRGLDYLTYGAAVAALYCALSLVLPMLSFGAVQMRFGEALTVLPAVSSVFILPLTLGCALTNTIGFFMGTNPFFFDILIGSTATLIAAYLSWALRNIKLFKLPLLSFFMPVIVNAFIIGGELSFIQTGGFTFTAFLLNSASVGLGQLVPCMLLGPALYLGLNKYKKYIGFLDRQ